MTNVADVLRLTVTEPTQQSDMLLNVLAGFFEEVANVSDDIAMSSSQVHQLPHYCHKIIGNSLGCGGVVE